MSQLSLGIATGLGVWTVGVGATALSTDSNNEEVDMLSLKTSIVKLTSAQDLKTKHKELPCVGELFGEVEWQKPGSTTSISALENTEVSGCLSVWWDKESYGEKWKGSWNLLWGMKNQSYGVVVATDVKANAGKIMADTSIYFLQKTQEKWSLISEMSLDKSEIKKENKKKEDSIMFPEDELIDSGNGWDFDFESEDICSSTKKCESEAPIQTSANLNWNFINKTDETKSIITPIHKWVKNSDKLLLFTFVQTPLSKIEGYFQLT